MDDSANTLPPSGARERGRTADAWRDTAFGVDEARSPML